MILTRPGDIDHDGRPDSSGDRRRLQVQNAAAIVSYAGINSSVNQSGSSSWKADRSQARLAVPEAGALPLRPRGHIGWTPGLRAFYDKKRSEGKCHRVAVMAVARKLCHIIYAILRDQVPFGAAGLSCATSFFSKVAMALFHCA